MSTEGYTDFTAIQRLWQDRRVTEEQMAILANLAREFAQLNEAPMQLKSLGEQLLHSSKRIIEFMEPTST